MITTSNNQGNNPKILLILLIMICIASMFGVTRDPIFFSIITVGVIGIILVLYILNF